MMQCISLHKIYCGEGRGSAVHVYLKIDSWKDSILLKHLIRIILLLEPRRHKNAFTCNVFPHLRKVICNAYCFLKNEC
uniref:Uncharacterized protein n=1 Tax=Anguilla anguilla TaxID=7936 RepID=A0A0E9XMY0_ANGAN